jgi:O-antigen/teichoic acid export membrane protein
MEDIRTYIAMIRRSGTYALATLTHRAAGLLMLPVCTRFLTTADYGVLELLDLTVNVIGMLIGVRLGSALFYFYAAAAGDRTRKDELVSTTLFGALILGAATGGLAICAAPQLSNLVFGSPAYARYFQLFFAGFAGDFVIEVGYSCLRLLDLPWTYFRVSIGRLLVQMTISAVLLVHFNMGVMAVLISSVSTGLAVALYMGWYVLRGVHIRFTVRTFLAMARYAAPLGISSLAMFFLHFGDRFFLKASVSLSDIGVYSVAYKLGMLVAYLQTTFTLFWNSQMYSIVEGPNGERIYARTCTYLTLVMAFSTVVLGVFARPLVASTLGREFQRVSDFVPIIAVAYVIRGVGEYFTSVFFLEKKTVHVALTTWAAAAVCLTGYAILIPRYHLWGAIAATVGGFSMLLIAGYWLAQRVRRFEFELARLLKIGAGMLTVLVLSATIRPAGIWSQYLFASALVVAFVGIIVGLGFFSSDEKTAIACYIHKLTQVTRYRLGRRQGYAAPMHEG